MLNVICQLQNIWLEFLCIIIKSVLLIIKFYFNPKSYLFLMEYLIIIGVFLFSRALAMYALVLFSSKKINYAVSILPLVLICIEIKDFAILSPSGSFFIRGSLLNTFTSLLLLVWFLYLLKKELDNKPIVILVQIKKIRLGFYIYLLIFILFSFLLAFDMLGRASILTNVLFVIVFSGLHVFLLLHSWIYIRNRHPLSFYLLPAIFLLIMGDWGIILFFISMGGMWSGVAEMDGWVIYYLMSAESWTILGMFLLNLFLTFRKRVGVKF